MNKPLDLKELMIDQAQLAKRLRQETSGEVMTDSASRGRYATDASIYKQCQWRCLFQKLRKILLLPSKLLLN